MGFIGFFQKKKRNEFVFYADSLRFTLIFYNNFYSSVFSVVAQTFMALMIEETKPPLSSSFIPLIVTPPGVVIRSISMQGCV